MMEHAASQSTLASAAVQTAGQYLLCVDGAGVFLLCLNDEVSIGGFREDENRADVCLMADLSRKHATIRRSEGGYSLEPHGSVTIDRRELPIDELAILDQTEELRLNDSVEIRFLRPNVLSRTAVLDFPGAHRPLVGQPPTGIDRVILMDQNCLFGEDPTDHIRLGDCSDSLILYRNKGRLWCKSKSEFRSNNRTTTTTCALESGDVIAGDDFRFRIEALTV